MNVHIIIWTKDGNLHEMSTFVLLEHPHGRWNGDQSHAISSVIGYSE